MRIIVLKSYSQCTKTFSTVIFMGHRLNRPLTTTKLTSRERDVLAYLMLGYKNKDIASELGVSLNTVRAQLAYIFAKFGVSNRIEAAIYYHKKMSDF